MRMCWPGHPCLTQKHSFSFSRDMYSGNDRHSGIGYITSSPRQRYFWQILDANHPICTREATGGQEAECPPPSWQNNREMLRFSLGRGPVHHGPILFQRVYPRSALLRLYPCLHFCVDRNFTLICHSTCLQKGFPGGVSGKEPTCKAGDTGDVGCDPWVGRAWQPVPAFLLGESHGQRSLVDYSPWGRREADMTETSRKSLLVSWMEPICTSTQASQGGKIPPEFLSQIRTFHPLKPKPCPHSLLSLPPSSFCCFSLLISASLSFDEQWFCKTAPSLTHLLFGI